MNFTLCLAQNKIDCAPEIRISGFFYVVDFGAEVTPRYHHVGKNAVCNCSLGTNCLAVQQVKAYLDAGGARAPEPRPGFYPVPPHHCPICGAAVVADHKLGSSQRGIGWRCTVGGKSHYWQRMGQHLAQRFQDKHNHQLTTATGVVLRR